jgi:hypothetical protein
MKYYSQLELEKIIEYLYDIQCEGKKNEEIESDKAIGITRRMLIRIQEINQEYLDNRIGQHIKAL